MKPLNWDLSISYFSIFFIINVFKYFGMYKRDMKPLKVPLLYLYFQTNIIMEENKKIENEEDPNSKPLYRNIVALAQW
jgi:hypothetical protein